MRRFYIHVLKNGSNILKGWQFAFGAMLEYLEIQMRNVKGIAYTRDPSTRGKLLPYEEKFAALIKAIAEHRDQNFTIVISEPWVIGDSYGEMVESLSRLADASLTLSIVQRSRDIRNN